MKKPNITPGPWNVVHMGREIYIETNHVFIADLQAKEAADLETAENDAKIIAAAPAMAEALEACFKDLAGVPEDDLTKKVKAALTLAGYEF